MSPRSNSARAPKTWKTSLPLAQIGHRLDQMLEGTPQAVEAPDDEGMSRSRVGQGFLQGFSLDQSPTGGLGEDLAAAGLGQGIQLEVENLLPGGDPRVSDVHTTIVSKLVGQRKEQSIDYDTGFETTAPA
jgi:hypothetical protein